MLMVPDLMMPAIEPHAERLTLHDMTTMPLLLTDTRILAVHLRPHARLERGRAELAHAR